MLSKIAHLARLVATGLAPATAINILDGPESVEQYTTRNTAAMDALEKRMLSPEYISRFQEIEAEKDPRKKAVERAKLKRENFESIDMIAVHRTIAARNRQMTAEGIIPADDLI